MTARLLITCDGTPADRPGMALETCRAFIAVAAFLELPSRGWTEAHEAHRRRDLCPSCTRALAAAS